MATEQIAVRWNNLQGGRKMWRWFLIHFTCADKLTTKSGQLKFLLSRNMRQCCTNGSQTVVSMLVTSLYLVQLLLKCLSTSEISFKRLIISWTASKVPWPFLCPSSHLSKRLDLSVAAMMTAWSFLYSFRHCEHTNSSLRSITEKPRAPPHFSSPCTDAIYSPTVNQWRQVGLI